MKIHNTDVIKARLFSTIRTKPLYAVQHSVFFTVHARCWSVIRTQPMRGIGEQLEIDSVMLTSAAVHLYVDEKMGLVTDEPDDEHDYEYTV